MNNYKDILKPKSQKQINRDIFKRDIKTSFDSMWPYFLGNFIAIEIIFIIQKNFLNIKAQVIVISCIIISMVLLFFFFRYWNNKNDKGNLIIFTIQFRRRR